MSSLDPIDFSYRNRHYHIPFITHPILQLTGDSATGKSLFVSDFTHIRGIESRYENSIIVNSESDYGMEFIKSDKYDYVLIDNADILMTPELDDFLYDRITTSTKTKYILMGRRMYSCTGSLSGLGSLVCEFNKKTKMYEFTVDFMHTF